MSKSRILYIIKAQKINKLNFFNTWCLISIKINKLDDDFSIYKVSTNSLPTEVRVLKRSQPNPLPKI